MNLNLPENVVETKNEVDIARLYEEVQNFIYRECRDGGSVKKLERLYKDFDAWKTKNGFDLRSHMEDISQALSDKL